MEAKAHDLHVIWQFLFCPIAHDSPSGDFPDQAVFGGDLMGDRREKQGESFKAPQEGRHTCFTRFYGTAKGPEHAFYEG